MLQSFWVIDQVTLVFLLPLPHSHRDASQLLMNTALNTGPPVLQTESSTPSHINALDGARPESARLDLHADPSMHPVQTAFDWRTSDPLDLQQPLPEMWTSIPQGWLQPEAPRPDSFWSDFSAMAGNYGPDPPDGALGPGRSLIASERGLPDPLIASSQDVIRVFPCIFLQYSSGDIPDFPGAPGPGRLQIVSCQSEVKYWLSLMKLGEEGSTQAVRSSNRGEDPQVNHDTVVPPARMDTRSSICSSSIYSPAYGLPAALSPSSEWHQGLGFPPQPTNPGPQTPMSATPMSAPALPPSPGFNQSPAPRLSYPGPSDSRCASAPTSIPAAPHYSLSHPPPPISYTANLDASRSAVHPHTFYQGGAPSMNDASIPFDPLVHPHATGTPSVSVPQLTTPTRGTAPVYPIEGQPSPEAPTQWQMWEHERMQQPHGRGRS